MYPVSTGFLAALASGHMRACVRVTTNEGVELAVTGGRVTMDSRRAIERDCDLTLVPTAELSTDDVYALLMDPTTEVTVERGLIVDGVAEYVPLGVFSTDSPEADISAPGVVEWKGSDRSRKIARARFTEPYAIASGTTLAAAGAALLANRWPLVETDFANVTATIGANIVYEHGASSDPWNSAQDLFADHGYYLHFNGSGVAVASVVPLPTATDTVFDFGSGATSLVLGGKRKGSLEKTYNGVIATGEGPDIATPVTASAWDTDETSPTYYLGPFGMVPYFHSSPLLTTTAMCALAASTRLATVIGRVEQLSWPAVVNPALEALDVVGVTIGATAATYVIDRVSIPLRAEDDMQAVARETRI